MMLGMKADLILDQIWPNSVSLYSLEVKLQCKYTVFEGSLHLMKDIEI